MTAQYIPVIMAFTFAAVVATTFVVASKLLGRGQLQPQRKLETYESGMPLLDASRKRVSVKFFVVAMVFIIFDLEVAFLFPVAVAARGLLAEGNAIVLFEVLAFLLILAIGYVYLWRAGAFDWARGGSKA